MHAIKLALFQNKLRSHYKNKVITYSKVRFEAPFLVILSSLRLKSNTHIYNQNTIMNLYLSEVEILDCVVENIDLTTENIKITSSIFTLKNSVLHNISDNVEANMMFANLGSNVLIESSNFTDSSSNLLISRNSKVKIENLFARNIEYESSIIQVLQSEYIKFDILNIVNVTVFRNRDPIIIITDSNNMQMSRLNVENIDKTVLKLTSSTIEMIDNSIIKNCTRAFTISESTVKMMTSNTFSDNGYSSSSYGGVMRITDSDIALFNNTFTNNKANRGAAISFV